ncbi:MAG: hypothetical protein PWP45_1712 [Tepidanaerobacteraceae bacterium]|nr:hypothetical protein [Tepidanaerobacteraceae bacterium]
MNFIFFRVKKGAIEPVFYNNFEISRVFLYSRSIPGIALEISCEAIA